MLTRMESSKSYTALDIIRASRTPSFLFSLILPLLISFIPRPLLGQERLSYSPKLSIRSHPQQVRDDPIIINTHLISLNVTVVDGKGRNVSGLNLEAFSILDDNVPQAITFFSDADEPISVGIIFDVSGSMSSNKIELARAALSRSLQTSHPQDEYFLIGFNSRAELLVDRTRDVDLMLHKIDGIKPKGDTALYDAVYLGADKLQRASYAKRTLLLISDGEENDSRHGFKELRSLLSEAGVLLYSICVSDLVTISGKAGMRVQDRLNRLAAVTGGSAFYASSTSEMDEVFNRIALELRHQYSIGYRPNNLTTDGMRHKIKVQVTPPDSSSRFRVRAKQGYFPINSLQQ